MLLAFALALPTCVRDRDGTGNHAIIWLGRILPGSVVQEIRTLSTKSRGPARVPIARSSPGSGTMGRASTSSLPPARKH